MIIIFSFYLILGIALQLMALVLLHHHSGWIIPISVNIFASGSIIIAIDQFKSKYHYYNNEIRFMIFVLCLFVPFFGIIASLFIMRRLYKSQHGVQLHPIQEVALTYPNKQIRDRYGIGGLRIHLLSSQFSLGTRINALKTLSTMAPNKINHLVRTILPDTVDELRLLAFYVISKQEKLFIVEINKSLQLLQQAETEQEKSKIASWLAFQYWELVYRNLVETSLVDFVLQKSYHYAKQALNYFVEDHDLLFLLGRISCKQKKYDEALQFFTDAITNGAGRTRILPYLAEVYFYQRNFSAIKTLFASNRIGVSMQIRADIMSFWGQSDE